MMQSIRRSEVVKILLVFMLLFTGSTSSQAATGHCPAQGVWLQVLGSGGPELGDRRASSSYLVWQDGHARIMVDAGGGSSLNFEHAGASVNDLEVILFSHFHVDHSAELPVYIKASFFSDRRRDLPVLGPSGNDLMPSMTDFVQALFAAGTGAFGYLSEYADTTQASDYHIRSQDVDASSKTPLTVYQGNGLKLSAIGVHHGPIPALAWRVELAGKVLVFSGDMNGAAHTLPLLARKADILIAHNAVPEKATGVARELHMPPSVIGEIAHKDRVKQLVLSHFMLRTLGREKYTAAIIRQKYHGPVAFAQDMECFRP